MNKEKHIQREIKDILEGKTQYGTVPIETRTISKHVRWIGINGYTNSIGQWIRKIEEMRKKFPITCKYRFYLPIDCDVKRHKMQRNMWYYGVRFELPAGDWRDYVCGGATDFSGEGGHGKQLADEYLKQISGQEALVLNADYLITMLTGGMD